MIVIELTKKRALMRYVSEKLNIGFIVDRDNIPDLVKENWYLRSNGTLIHESTKKPLTHYIFKRYNGWEPRKIMHKDGNCRNCLPENLIAME